MFPPFCKHNRIDWYIMRYLENKVHWCIIPKAEWVVVRWEHLSENNTFHNLIMHLNADSVCSGWLSGRQFYRYATHHATPTAGRR